MEKKEYTIKDVKDLLLKKTKEALETIEKSEKEGNDHKIENVTLPEGQLIPKTKENKDGMPEATGKTMEKGEHQPHPGPSTPSWWKPKPKMEKANPMNRTSAQMAGLKIPSQPKPPKAAEKPIDNTAAKAIKPPKMPGLGAGLKKFMNDRSEKLQKATTGHEKGVHTPSIHTNQGGESKAGNAVRWHKYKKDNKEFGADWAKKIAKDYHKQNLDDIKSMPKPDLGKAEKQNGPKKADLKGVHKPAFMDSVKSGTSDVGARIPSGGLKDMHRKGIEATKQDHKKVLSEIKAMPKPDLGKSEDKDSKNKKKAENRAKWDQETPHFGGVGPHRYDGGKSCVYCERPKDYKPKESK